MKKFKKFLAVALAMCMVLTIFATQAVASGQNFYSYDVDGGQICLVDGLAYFYGVEYYNGGISYAGSYDPQGILVWSADSTITKAVIPSTYTGYATSSSGGDYEYGEGPYLEDEPITGIQGITGGDSGAFAGCTLLTSVTIPSTVKYIYGGAFAGCTSLTEVIFENNDYYCYVDGAIYTKDMTTLVCYIDGSRTSFVVPNTVTEIGDFAFVGAPSLTSITIPASVTTIGIGALTGTGLTSVTFEQGSPFTAENNLILSADKTKVISYYGNVNGVTVPASVTEISELAFWGVDTSSSYSSTPYISIYRVYYQGTETEWNVVSIDETNISTSVALTVYYSCYAVNVDDVENGIVSIVGSSDHGIYMDNWDNSGTVTSSGMPAYDLFVKEGSTVEIYASGDIGYTVSSVSVTDDNGKSIDVTLTGYIYTFVMPASNVEISVNFKAASASTECTHTLTYVSAVAATSTTAGNIEYWYCSTCGKYFSDEGATSEIEFKDTVISATGTTEPDLSNLRADYTPVKNAIAKANALNASDYTNFSEVTEAINAVNWSCSVLQQSAVNGMAEKIENAIAKLIPVGIVTEEVTIIEPVEDTDTDDEPDEMEVSEPVEEPEPEANPTTGVALSLIPAAIAALAAASSRRKTR